MVSDSAIRIVVPDDDPAALRGTNVEDRLRRLSDLVIYDSLAPDPSDLAVRLKDASVT